MATRSRLLTRRRALVGAAVALTGAVVGVEYESFTGAWDHRKKLRLDGQARFAESVALLESGSAQAKALEKAALLHVGHSTHCLILDGVRFLTDPWFYDPAFGALEHDGGTATDPADLPRLDAILISHDHADHCDERALARMKKNGTVCLVATDSLAKKVTQAGFEEVHVVVAGDSFTVHGVRVEVVPGIHDVYEIGFVLVGSSRTVYFAGDSAIHPDLPRIRDQFAPQVSILPVDGTRVRGSDLSVMRPIDAVEASRQLASAILVPSHAEAIFFDPVARYLLTENIEKAAGIFERMMREKMPERTVLVPRHGEITSLAG